MSPSCLIRGKLSPEYYSGYRRSSIKHRSDGPLMESPTQNSLPQLPQCPAHSKPQPALCPLNTWTSCKYVNGLPSFLSTCINIFLRSWWSTSNPTPTTVPTSSPHYHLNLNKPSFLPHQMEAPKLGSTPFSGIWSSSTRGESRIATASSSNTTRKTSKRGRAP